MMAIWLFLCLLSPCYGMEVSNRILTAQEVASRIEELYDRPWYKQAISSTKDYQDTKKLVISYLEQLQRDSHKDVRDVQRSGSIEVLLDAARKTSEERSRQKQSLSLSSKLKIGMGSFSFLLGLAQTINSIVFTVKEDCDSEYKATSDFVAEAGLMISSAMVVYNGVKNADAKADAGRAEHIELLLLQKFRELRSKE